MKEEFNLLSKNEIALLLKAPAIVSFLAAIGTGEINQWRKVETIKLAHLKTFTACSLLVPYYKEAERVFDRNYEMITRKYIPFDTLSRTGLQTEMDAVNRIIEKLDRKLADELRASLMNYTEHVKTVYRNSFINFYHSISYQV
ncbi:MAG TPA: hypothetical protein VGQ59_13065 [Cyclobacteriaceae bacterium]|jgi:hypothetical protein|nr:hypothetical protein [Cyclobacteriaceae bacterium]